LPRSDFNEIILYKPITHLNYGIIKQITRIIVLVLPPRHREGIVIILILGCRAGSKKWKYLRLKIVPTAFAAHRILKS